MGVLGIADRYYLPPCTMINHNFNEQERVLASGSNLSQSVLIPTLENLLTHIQADQIEIDLTHWSQRWHLQSFQLGDLIYNLPVFSETTVHDEPNSKSLLYLVIKGRVRLLAWEQQLNREVSVLVVESGEIFGGEQQEFKDSCLSYQAIAASEVIVASIPIAELQTQLQQILPLQTYLQTTIQNRQRILFFKTQTH